jgi:hypothetical protein
VFAIGVFYAAGRTTDAILGVLAVVGNEVGWKLGREGHCDDLMRVSGRV